MDHQDIAVPGGFPETPAVSQQSARGNADASDSFFAVNPIPATAGTGNPIALPAGQTVPHASQHTDNTINSTVRLDQASYERSDAGPPVLPQVLTEQEQAEARGASMFTLPPIGGNMIPESSLPMNESRQLDQDASPFINSVSSQSTTTKLASEAPVLPRGVPDVVGQSQESAHAAPEASASRDAVLHKAQLERELQQTVKPTAAADSENPRSTDTTSGVTSVLSGSIAAASSAASSAATAVTQATQQATESLKASDPVGALPVSIQRSIEKINGTSAVTTTTKPDYVDSSNVPAIVRESQQVAHVSPEAASSSKAVDLKAAVEQELRSEVAPTYASSQAAPVNSQVSDAQLPAVVMDSQRQAHEQLNIRDPVANETLHEKVAMQNQLRNELKPTYQAGAPAPTASAALTATVPSASKIKPATTTLPERTAPAPATHQVASEISDPAPSTPTMSQAESPSKTRLVTNTDGPTADTPSPMSDSKRSSKGRSMLARIKQKLKG